MICSLWASTRAAALAARGLTTSAAIKSGTPTYTYASPGTSMTEPEYSPHGESKQETSMAEPEGRVTPSKKAGILKTKMSRQRKLVVQGAGVQMLPPGCSISDPSYSIKDPVYFTDVEK